MEEAIKILKKYRKAKYVLVLIMAMKRRINDKSSNWKKVKLKEKYLVETDNELNKVWYKEEKWMIMNSKWKPKLLLKLKKAENEDTSRKMTDTNRKDIK